MARITQIILLALISLAAVGLFSLESKAGSEERLKFETWKTTMNKNYDEFEQPYRFGIWLSNLKYVEEHNARFHKGEETYELQMNLFADLTSEEFGAKYLGYDSDLKVTSKCTGNQAPSQNLPDEIDWSTKGAVTPIKNQGQCGSCWAFSTTGSIEGAHFLSSSKLSSFSEQQLVDCSKSYGNHGCQGGLMDFAFYYIKDEGITLESSHAYKGVNGQCHYNKSTDSAWTISDCTDVTVDKEEPLMAAVAQQPVSVAIQANHLSFQLYKKGVYTGNCGTKLDHGVLAYGYGTESGKKYWRVKNSWGAGWGQAGSILIERTGDGKGKCGIQMSASFPIA